MPVPPAIMPTFDACKVLVPDLKLPLPRYSCMPHGPEMSILSPTYGGAASRILGLARSDVSGNKLSAIVLS